MNKKRLIKRVEAEFIPYPESKYAKGFNAGVGRSLKFVKELDEPKKPIIPQFVADLVLWTKQNNAVPGDILHEFVRYGLKEINLPDDLELEKLNEYFNFACHRYDYEKACIIGYKVEKEPEWIVKVGDNYFHSWTIHSSCSPYTVRLKSNAHRIKDKKKADALAIFIDGEAVPAEGEE